MLLRFVFDFFGNRSHYQLCVSTRLNGLYQVYDPVANLDGLGELRETGTREFDRQGPCSLKASNLDLIRTALARNVDDKTGETRIRYVADASYQNLFNCFDLLFI